MKTYGIRINEAQRAWLHKAAERFAADVDQGLVATVKGSDPAPEGCLGSCIGEELEALRDMLQDLEPDDCNDFTA